MRMHRLELFGTGQGSFTGYCEVGNELSDSIK
jgi:hypothetical protein